MLIIIGLLLLLFVGVLCMIEHAHTKKHQNRMTEFEKWKGKKDG